MGNKVPDLYSGREHWQSLCHRNRPGWVSVSHSLQINDDVVYCLWVLKYLQEENLTAAIIGPFAWMCLDKILWSNDTSVFYQLFHNQHPQEPWQWWKLGEWRGTYCTVTSYHGSFSLLLLLNRICSWACGRISAPSVSCGSPSRTLCLGSLVEFRT